MMNVVRFRNLMLCGTMSAALAVLLCGPATLLADNNKSKPAPPPKAAPKPAAAPKPPAPSGKPGGTTGAHPSTTTGSPGGHVTTPANAHTTTPGGMHTTTPAGARNTPAGGKTFGNTAGKAPTRVVQTKSGAQVHYNASGHVAVVHAHGMEIHHGPAGTRTIVRTRPGGVTVVSNRYGHGYIGHEYRFNNTVYVQRTYYYNGVVYGRYYRPYTYWGVPINVYAPAYYYAPAFYGWAYNPWVTPVAYPWGWAGNPWYGYYGAYFTPYPVYASPALWLTDYFVSQTLQAAYAERQAELANAQLQATAPLTPDVKNAISDEVRRQIALENSEATAGAQAAPDPGSSGIARILADNTTHVFVASAPLEVPSNAGGTCVVTEGDVLQLSPGTPANSTSATLLVLASKGQDCMKGSAVEVGLSDLQDMQNHMRETIDQGLADLRTKQGQNGIPAAPKTAAAEPVKTGFAEIAPPPDPNVKTELAAQTKEGDDADREAVNEAGAAGPNAGAGGAGDASMASNTAPAPAAATPKTISVGQSTADVVATMGQPKNIVDLGAKKIYVYPNLKVTFKDGKVSDVQ